MAPLLSSGRGPRSRGRRRKYSRREAAARADQIRVKRGDPRDHARFAAPIIPAPALKGLERRVLSMSARRRARHAEND